MIPIVLSTQRTGSTFLFLHFHPTFKHVCFEPYNSEIQREEYKEIASAHEFKNRIMDPVAYFQYLSQFGVIDIKLEIAPKFVLEQIYKNHKRFNAVILSRRNMLRQYISSLTAGRSVIFSDSKEQQEKPLTVDFDKFNAYRTILYDHYLKAKNGVPDAPLVTYEDMDIDSISHCLDTPVTHTPGIKKLHNDYSFITNRKALKTKYPLWPL